MRRTFIGVIAVVLAIGLPISTRPDTADAAGGSLLPDFVVENVFVLPGIGRLVFQAINNRDLIVVRDVVMLLAATVVAVSFVVDVLYALIDPRLRTAAG